MRKVTLITLGLLTATILAGCGDTSAKDLTEEVQTSYNQAIQESEVANEGKSLGDFIDQAHSYSELRIKLNTLDKNLTETPENDYSSQYEEYFGCKPENADEAKQWTEDALDLIVADDRDLLSPFARKMKDAESITNKDFGEQKISFSVEDTSLLLNELHLSASSFGKILAMTDIYASKIDFSETGFDFSWDGEGGVFEVKYIPYPAYWNDFVERFNSCIDNYNTTTDQIGTQYLSALNTLDADAITLVEGTKTYTVDINTSGNYQELFTVDFNDDFTDWTFMQICCNLWDASNNGDQSTLLDSYFHSFVYARAMMYALQPNISFDQAKEQAAKIIDRLSSSAGASTYDVDIDGIHYNYTVSNGPRAAISITRSK